MNPYLLTKDSDYFIFPDGRCYSKLSKKYVKAYKNVNVKCGYYYYQLYINKKKMNLYIHRLVATNYVANPFEKKVVNHKDFDKTNNHMDNLEWLSHIENIHHSMNNDPNWRNKNKTI